MWSAGRTLKFQESLGGTAQDLEQVGLIELRSAVNQLASVDIEAVCDIKGGVGTLAELMHGSPMRSRDGGDGALRLGLFKEKLKLPLRVLIGRERERPEDLDNVVVSTGAVDPARCFYGRNGAARKNTNGLELTVDGHESGPVFGTSLCRN